MPRTGILFLLVLLSAVAHGETPWKGTSTQSIVEGSGDVLDTRGSAVMLSGESLGKAAFIGTITSVEADSYKGKEVRFAGLLRVDEGAGAAALWVRADGPKGGLAFANTSREPVHAGDGTRARELLLYVPVATTSLKFGLTLESTGHLRAEHLTLTSKPSEASGVSAHDMMAHALPLIRAKALNTGNVDWPAEEAALLDDDLKTFPPQEAYSRLRKVLDALADRHSNLHMPKDALAYRERTVATRAIESRPIAGIGYLLVPGLRSTDPSARAAFTAELCSRIGALAPTSSKGWILDLRENTGGNMWPMLNGLHSLLGSNDAGAFRDRDGATTHWRLRASNGCRTDLSDSPVAVLVGRRTVSSGEAVAVAFRGRPGTRFFGQTTAGLATANTSFDLPDGGALRLTTAVMVDRDGTTYPRGITPENVAPGNQDAIATAAAWLRSMP